MHSRELLEKLKKTKGLSNEEELEKLSGNYEHLYFHPKIYDIALLAAGSSIELVESVLKDDVQNGMAIVRPPGNVFDRKFYLIILQKYTYLFPLQKKY